MTNKEAIEVLRVAQTEVEWEYPLDIAIAIDKAIEAMKKQIPKKKSYKEIALEKFPKMDYAKVCPSHIFGEEIDIPNCDGTFEQCCECWNREAPEEYQEDVDHFRDLTEKEETE